MTSPADTTVATPDLVCHVYDGWDPRIRPASSRRDWMEATQDRFAYRCLPLTIANAHGWEVPCRAGFEAVWDGGAGVEAVTIFPDFGADARDVAVSLFGAGTITFHIEGIIRTSPGWNLWVGGPPNDAKDGLAPLSGVIETDWSPYSFTMNWRFTRPGQRIRFDADEAFCFFFPVPRTVAAVEPRCAPIEAEPGLRQAFETWSESRDALHDRMRDGPPAPPSDQWQKLYYRGLGPDGEPWTDVHESKLRTRPFAASADAASYAAKCPVAHPGQPGPSASRDSLALKRRNWLLDVGARQCGLSDLASTVMRIRDLDRRMFLDHFYAPGRPVVIEGAMAGWPALDWTPARLRARVGDVEVEYQARRERNANFELDKDHHLERGSFLDFLDHVTGDTTHNDMYMTAYNSAANVAALRPLTQDMGYLDRYLTPGHGMMWIGPAGAFTPLHFDLTNNLLAQFVGRKCVTLIAPSETPRLAHDRHVFSAIRDLKDPARLDAFPHAREVRSIDVALEPGDLLYIPVGWWHQVSSLEFSVMATYTNFLWANDAYTSYPSDD